MDEDLNEATKNPLLEKIDRMNEQYQSLRKSLVHQINDSSKDNATVSNIMTNLFEDEPVYNHHPMTTKST